MNRVAALLALLSLALMSGCGGGQGDTELAAEPVGTDEPDSFLRFLNTQASLAAGSYQVVVATASSGMTGDYILKVTHDDGRTETFSGSWPGSGSGGQDPASADNPVHTVTLDRAGGLRVSLVSEDADSFLFLTRNGQVVASDNDSGEGLNALIDLPVTQIHSKTYSRAYYEAVDPFDMRTTLADWKAANNFGTGECLHVVFRDTKDLGYGRNMRACKQSNGNVAVFVKNYVVKVLPGDPDNYGPLNLDAALQEQRRHLLGTNAIEFSPLDTAGASSTKVAKFFTFDSDGNRIIEADLDGRGARAMPQPCLLCHGAKLYPLEPNGSFPEESLRSAKLNQLEVDSFEFADHGAFTRAGAEDELRRLNAFVHSSFKAMDARADDLPGVWEGDFAIELSVGRYGNDFTQGTYQDGFVPAGWQAGAGRPEGVELLYKRVIQPHCIACHSLRGSRTGERVSPTQPFPADGNAINFSSYEKFIGYSDLVIDYVYKRGVMPLSLRNFNSFWEDPDGAPALLASFLPGFDRFDANGKVIPPGKPVARTGLSRTLTSPAQLDGSRSLFATSWQWVVKQAPGTDWTLHGAGTARPVLEAPTDGTYTLELTVGGVRGNDSTEVQIEIDSAQAVPEDSLTFTDHIVPVLQSSHSGTREPCANCHTGTSLKYEGIPVLFTTNADLYRDVMARVDLAEPENSLLLRKPTREQHGGGQVIDTTTVSGRALREMLVKWIREGAVCGDGPYCP